MPRLHQGSLDGYEAAQSSQEDGGSGSVVVILRFSWSSSCDLEQRVGVPMLTGRGRNGGGVFRAESCAAGLVAQSSCRVKLDQDIIQSQLLLVGCLKICLLSHEPINYL